MSAGRPGGASALAATRGATRDTARSGSARLLALALFALGMLACSPGPAAVDAGCATPGTRGCPCPREGDVICPRLTSSSICWAGVWAELTDGPCGFYVLPDAGLADAAPDTRCSTPSLGCACTCEQERLCEGGSLLLQCVSGRWRSGLAAVCTPGPTCP